MLIAAIAVPIVATLFIWYKSQFETPMPKAVLDAATSEPWVFSIFILLIAGSFATQYFFSSPTTRKYEVRTRTPILILIGPMVILAVSLLAWWRSEASFFSIVYMVAQKPLLLASVVGLTIGGLLLAFFMSTKDLQKRFLKVLTTLVSVFFMVLGPSYFIYGLQTAKMPYHIAVSAGLISLIVGIILFSKFVSKETES